MASLSQKLWKLTIQKTLDYQRLVWTDVPASLLTILLQLFVTCCKIFLLCGISPHVFLKWQLHFV